MKKTKIALTLVCAILLVAASVMGTLAYLTSTATVTNSFTVGNVTLGNTNEAGLDEAKTTAAGVPVDSSDKELTKDETTGKYNLTAAKRVDQNTYKLQPGHTYVKDPTIHVGDSSDDCYLFVKVENGISDIEATTGNGYSNIEAQMAAKGWKQLGTSYANIWYYAESTATEGCPSAVKAGADKVVFEEFKVSESVSNLSSYANAKIVVTAYAVQTDGFEGQTAAAIWDTAFATT